MISFWAKALFGGLIVALAATLARRAPALGALVAALPLTSIVTMTILWYDKGDRAQVAGFSESVFWFVVPTLPMFLLMPAMLRAGWGYWPTLAAGCTLTIALYLCVRMIALRFGVTI